MSFFAQQAPALVGVVVGAAASYATVSLGERKRWRRKLSTRWDQRRLSTYMDYAASVKNLFHLALRLATARGVSTLVVPMDPVEGARLCAEAEERRSTHWESVLMLGDPETISAARAWHGAVLRLIQTSLKSEFSVADWEAARAVTAGARDRYYESARASLGVAGFDKSADVWTQFFSDQLAASSLIPSGAALAEAPAL